MAIIQIDNFNRYPLFGKRPISPHLTVYRFPFPAVLSVIHRGTGIALYVIVLGLFYIESMSAVDFIDYDLYYMYQLVNRPHTIFAYIVYTCVVFSLSYHMFNGFRHYIWNTRRFLTLRAVYITGYLTVLFSILTTAAIMTLIINGYIW